MLKNLFILFFVFGFLGEVLTLATTEVCSSFGNDFYHEGIEYIPSKGLIVGRVGGNAANGNSITIVHTNGSLTPWTSTARTFAPTVVSCCSWMWLMRPLGYKMTTSIPGTL